MHICIKAPFSDSQRVIDSQRVLFVKKLITSFCHQLGETLVCFFFPITFKLNKLVMGFDLEKYDKKI